MKRNDLSVYYADPKTLIPYKNNAKRHDEKQIQQIVRSIQEFGFNDPIGIDEDNVVVEGHGRLLAALQLGLDVVPVVRITGLTDEQRRAYSLVHNKLTINSGFDIDILNEELDRITDIDMTAYSFHPEESFFDPAAEYEPKSKGEIVAVVEPWQAEDIRNLLIENLIDYKEKDAR